MELTFSSEMIDELKSVLVPDDEIARIRQYGDVMREAREQRAKEREQLLATIHGVFVCGDGATHHRHGGSRAGAAGDLDAGIC